MLGVVRSVPYGEVLRHSEVDLAAMVRHIQREHSRLWLP
jgi:hypothetical protein